MKSKIYTEQEIILLKQNPFVLDIKYNRFIEYDPIFKLWCVLAKNLYPEVSARSLFYIAGFPLQIMNPNLPQKRILAWRNIFFRYGKEYFLYSKDYEMLNIIPFKNMEINRESTNDLKKRIYSEVRAMLENEKR